MHRERALDADAEGLLADGEGLARAAALALDHDALEDLGAPAGALDDLEVHAHAVARLEDGHSPQLGTLDAVDDAGHRRRRDLPGGSARAGMVAKASPPAGWRVPPALAALLEPPLADLARGRPTAGSPAPCGRASRRARVVRVLGRALERRAERLLDRALLVAERPRQLAHHRVADHHRRQLAARTARTGRSTHVGREVLVHALVEALVAPAQQRELLLAGQLGGERVVELPPAGRQRDHAARRRDRRP